MDLLEAAAYDMELAGAELLGRDVARLCSPPALAQVQSLLESEPDLERLVSQMVQTSTHDEATTTVERTVSSFCRGILKNA
jgi:predicted nucleotidyltransferase